ncbi:hypothetical protein M8C21_004617, partial [Ambrosia artemisiifolia]
DMQDMRDCYDSLLTAAASTTNTAYESLQEMGSCLLEKTALSDDEDSGRVLLMLGKVQFEIQKLIDIYRSHLSQTITAPSQSLVNELLIVEDMKKQCDDKRETYEALKTQYEKGKMKGSKVEHVSSRQLQTACDEFDEDATLKAYKSLEAIEPHVKATTEQQHIDYHFSGLEDDDRDSVFLTDDDEDEEDDDSDYNDDTFVDSELNTDQHMNVRKNELDNEEITFPQVPVKSAMVNMNRKPLGDSTIDLNKGYKSAPLSMESNYDPSERYRQMRQSSVRKLNTYVLPTPLEKKSVTSGIESQTQSQGPKPKPSTNIYHSMPLEKSSGKPTPLPAPQTVHSSPPIDPHSTSSAKKIKRYAFSGPLTGNSQLNKTPLYASGPIGSTARHLPVSGSVLPTSLTQPLSSSEAYPLSSSMVSTPVISELHELPRPPVKKDSKKPSKVGFSAPLVTYKHSPDTSMVSPPLSPIEFKVI